MDNFFCKFGIWRQEYPRDVIDRFRQEQSKLLNTDYTDWKLEVVNDNEVVLTGILPQFADHKTMIIQLLKEARKVQK